VCSADWHESRELVVLVRLHDEMGEATRARVDDDIGKLAERTVSALYGALEVESHEQTRSTGQIPDDNLVAPLTPMLLAFGSPHVTRCG
jgi:hypothetical protein